MTDCFSADSPLRDHVELFAPRPGQQQMAQAVAESLSAGEVLFCEAGTGIGKTMAYLVPVLLSNCRTIVSTGTRHLQDQIYEKDLPALHRALALEVRTTVLKGRANYLCLHRMHATLDGGLLEGQESDLLSALRQWAQSTASGDFSEFPELPEDSSLLPDISSTAENCLGSKCEYFTDCFVYQARKQAEESDLIITNHHLLLSDMVLRAEGHNSMLPDVDVIIFDEAHLLPELASVFFGATLSSRGLTELLEDTLRADKEEAGDNPELGPLMRKLTTAVKTTRLALKGEAGRTTWSTLCQDTDTEARTRSLLACWEHLLAHLDTQKERGEMLEQCHRRCARQCELLRDFLDPPGGQEWEPEPAPGPAPESESAQRPQPGEQVRWVETRRKGFALHATPLDVSQVFQEGLNSYSAQSIYTSATLAAGDDFRHFYQQLGFDAARELLIGTPFQLSRQALLYLPDDLPAPRAPEFLSAFLKRVEVLLDYSQGRAFVLFTSHRALKEAARQLKKTVPWMLLVQGDAPRGRLLQRFREQQNSVLLGTSSFWEGVDIRGEALSSVIIEKLPFASPGDPVMQARIESMQRAGRDPFMEYQVPRAMLSLKQGVGRLIRDMEDRGVCTICDHRIRTTSYGKKFLDMLSAWPCTDELEAVRHFYNDVVAAG